MFDDSRVACLCVFSFAKANELLRERNYNPKVLYRFATQPESTYMIYGTVACNKFLVITEIQTSLRGHLKAKQKGQQKHIKRLPDIYNEIVLLTFEHKWLFFSPPPSHQP